MSPWFVALFAGPAVLIPLAVYALSRRQVRRARWYGLLLITLPFWSLSYAWELSGQDLATKILALKVKYLGVVALPPAWIGFILELVGSGRGRVRRFVLPLSIVALSVFTVLWTNERHGLFWGPMVVEDIGDYIVLRGRGPGFWVNIAYTYAVLAAGIVLLLLHAVHSPYLYRRRAGIVIAGTVAPWIGNAYFILHPAERIFDPTPFLFTCTALIAALAVFRYDVLEPVPTLRDARIDWVGDGVIILDARRRVADLNAAAEAALGTRRLEAAGTVIDHLLPSWPSGALPDGPMDVTLPERDCQIGASATANDLEVVVADTGIGMAPDFLPHIFDAFRQADSGENRKARGLGLGLNIVRRIVEAHDGRIEAESEGPGRGSTFRLSLPVTHVATAPRDATESDSPGWDS